MLFSICIIEIDIGIRKRTKINEKEAGIRPYLINFITKSYYRLFPELQVFFCITFASINLSLTVMKYFPIFDAWERM